MDTGAPAGVNAQRGAPHLGRAPEIHGAAGYDGGQRIGSAAARLPCPVMRRRGSPLSAPHASDPAHAETQNAVDADATLTLSGGHDAFTASTIDMRGASAPPEGEVRVSIAPPVDEAGQPRYEPGALLGVGGMGEVRLHVDRRIGRPVALKTLRAERGSAHAEARFLREARVQGQLEHPSIVPVYDLGTDGAGRPYFTMKRVRGLTLAAVIDRLAAGDDAAAARFSRHKLLHAFVQVCMAIEYAHTRGVLHRDLKPQNIMLGDFGEVYVLDWGLAKAAGEPAPEQDAEGGEPALSGAAPMTRAGEVMGTPLYMSPEQLRADHDALGAQSDLFALGAILFEILTLSPYRRPDNLEKMVEQSQFPRVELPSERAAGVAPELDAICARALAPDPAERPRSALAIAEVVESYLEGDRDEAARRAAAEHLAASARRKLAASPGAEGRVEAMREALKALALKPDDQEVQHLLLSLVVDGSGPLPEEAEREFAEVDVETRRRGTRFGMYGYLSWLASLPLAMWLGVRSWTIPIVLTAITVLCTLTAFVFVRRGIRSTAPGLVLSILSGAVVALSSGWLGPFVLTPLAACATAVMFVLHSTRAERPWLIGVWATSALLPFAAELSGLVPPAYAFRAGEIVLHARMLDLPPGPTLTALAYTSVSFLVLLSVFVGRLRDQQRTAERRLFVQAWHLRQLFPSGRAATPDV
jgi:serine/threonine-protein kinase